MVFNTATVGTAVTPVVIQTFFSHYLNRKPLSQKPTAHISYDEGLHLIRKFLLYASHNTVEDVQRFTSQWVPNPHWVKVDEVTITEEFLKKGAEAIQEQLGPHGIAKVGGKTWWQWRRPESKFEAEWIEMRADYHERKKNKDMGKRVMLYVHGGAYFFGSVDEHRYQMQRHARKLKALSYEVPEPSFLLTSTARYRLAPQFPFPCGLHDCLSAYLYLLTVQDPTTIILAGDSAGGGMVVSMLVTMRDRGIPLPAGAILLSPWVDLTHSFPSVAGDNPLDYIPAHGFHQRPSPSWPPPNSDDMIAMQEAIVKKLAHADHASHPQENEDDAVQGFHIDKSPDSGLKNDTAATGTVTNDGTGPAANTVPGPGHNISIMIDGNLVEIKDQIQMYASNQLISHPLVSPILQPSLGGLPPLLILTGGGEALRDEQIYLAHKAANPTKYPPGDAFLDESPHDHNRNQVNRWKPTDVQLQVWDDLCHVAPTLSFTRPAKYMYRSIAQFGAWTLARAQKTEIDILDDDDVSIISNSDSDSDSNSEDAAEVTKVKKSSQKEAGHVGKAGDPLPPFVNHMIRQRVDRHGIIAPLEPESELSGCCLPPSDVGVVKEGPVRKWMTAKKQWDTKFASSKRKVQKQRAKEMAKGYYQFGDGEVPSPSALAGRRITGEDLKEKKKGKSYGMSLWALWGSKHDEKTTIREEKADKEPETSIVSPLDGANARNLHDTKTKQGKKMDAQNATYSRSRSRRRTVTDQNQTGHGDIDENTPASVLYQQATERGTNDFRDLRDGNLTPDFVSQVPTIRVRSPTIEWNESELKRPKAGGLAYPFSLKQEASSASMTTLTSAIGVQPIQDLGLDGAKNSGVEANSTDKDASAAIKSEKGTEIGTSAAPERPPLDTFVTAVESLPKAG